MYNQFPATLITDTPIRLIMSVHHPPPVARYQVQLQASTSIPIYASLYSSSIPLACLLCHSNPALWLFLCRPTVAAFAERASSSIPTHPTFIMFAVRSAAQTLGRRTFSSSARVDTRVAVLGAAGECLSPAIARHRRQIRGRLSAGALLADDQ